MTDEELIERLRKLGSMWFNTAGVLLLEELIRRFQNTKSIKEKKNE